MPDSSRAYSSLYYRLFAARCCIPLVASLGAIIFEIVEQGSPFPVGRPLQVIELLTFAVVGPGLIFLALTWLLARVAERDRAESQLALVAAQERQLLATFERIVRTKRLELVPMLEQLLAAICEADAFCGGAIYLLPLANGASPVPAASWPPGKANALLDGAARHIAQAGPAELAVGRGLRPVLPAADGYGVAAAPVTAASEQVALLVLAFPAGLRLPESNIVSIVTSTMALLIHNGQLYARLQGQAILEERKELAREVHDTLAQTVGFLSLKAQHAQRLVDRGLFHEVSGVLDELATGSRIAYGEVRQIVGALRSPAGIADGLAACLQEFAASAAARTGLEIAVDSPAEPQLSPDARLQLLRVVQEAVNNVYRHARARHVLIRLAGGPEGVRLSVEDDGAGLPRAGGPGAGGPGAGWQEAFPAPDGAAAAIGEHLGLRMMAERVQSLGGELRLESHPGRGTVLTVCVPESAGLAGARPASAASAHSQEGLWTGSAS